MVAPRNNICGTDKNNQQLSPASSRKDDISLEAFKPSRFNLIYSQCRNKSYLFTVKSFVGVIGAVDPMVTKLGQVQAGDAILEKKATTIEATDLSRSQKILLLKAPQEPWSSG